MGAGMVVAAVLIGACSAPPPPPAGKPEPAEKPAAPPSLRMEKEALQLGKACATGQSVCGGGVCDLTVKNDCEAPLTCDVFVSSSCRTTSGTGEGRGRKRGTFPAKAEEKLNVPALCPEGGEALRTTVTDLKCQ
jgi:hypothetical protein